MATKSDDTGACCCSAAMVVVAVGIIAWIVDFVSKHPVWTALIVITVVGLLVVAAGAKSDAPPSTAPSSANAGEAQPRRASDSRAHSGAARAPVREPPPTGQSNPQVCGTSTTSRSPEGAEPATGPGEISHSTSPSTRDADKQAPNPVMGPEEFVNTIKALVKRDGWAILGASLTSARGGIDIIAGSGSQIIALQCHAPANAGNMDDSAVRRLAAAAFDVHGITDVALISSVPVSGLAREAADSQRHRIHIIDADEFIMWKQGLRRLLPL